MWITVPANLLLCGEYVITGEGHLGVACAVDIRAKFTILKSDAFALEPLHPGSSGADDGLVEAVVRAFRNRFFISELPKVTVRADTSSFYHADGSKIGLGSSAVAAVGIASALYYSCSNSMHFPVEVFYAALEGHREFQGGGSGYDVAASFYGGLGLFKSGRLPGWDPIQSVVPAGLRLVPGEKPQSSMGAAKLFRQWMEREPELADRYCRFSDRVAAKFARALELGTDPGAALHRARCPGQWLGEKIGVPAYPGALQEALESCRKQGCPGKASGAGGELGVAFVLENSYFFTMDSKLPGWGAAISPEGIQWSQ